MQTKIAEMNWHPSEIIESQNLNSTSIHSSINVRFIQHSYIRLMKQRGQNLCFFHI